MTYPMQPTERDRERFRDAARQHLTWCDFNRTGIDGDYKDAETRYLFKMWWSVERERQLLQNLNMSQGCKLSELAQNLGKAEAELARMREQKPLTWGTSGELMEILKNPIYSSPAPVPAVAAVPEDYRQALVEIALRCTDHDTTDAIDALLQSGSDPVAHHPV